MPQKYYNRIQTVPATPLQRPAPSLKRSEKVDFEAPDPADINAQRYRQSLPPNPWEIKPLRPPPPPPSSTSSRHTPRQTAPLRQSRPLEMRPLTEIGRHTSPSPRRLARNTSNASSRTRQSLPKIEEIPDLDSDATSIDSSNHSRSSSDSSDSKFAAIEASCLSTKPRLTSQGTAKHLKVDRREAVIQASIDRTSWMIDEEGEKGRGSKDLVEHINYVMSAWQREK